MLRQLQVIIIAVLFSGCAHVNSVNIDSALGNEVRPGHNRESVVVGVLTKFVGGAKIGFKYRHRLTDFASNSTEHGFFIGTSIPIWKKSK